ncbi:hypothetical protein FACS1894206_03330 [Deltaproteobacteria bacterium]|nr:hypothetical protein FACS1894206_03330 [Deltaproteobacteria bacterium]
MKSPYAEISMPDLPPIAAVKDIRLGCEARVEAWIQHFLIENNIDPSLSPGLVATREQLCFMVALAEDQVYVPCSDRLFLQFYRGEASSALDEEYADAWNFIEQLLESSDLTSQIKQRALLLCRYRFNLYVNSGMILPSRLIKRLVGIVLNQMHEPDPFREKKIRDNAAMARIFANPAYTSILNACPGVSSYGSTFSDVRRALDCVELERLMRMATHKALWTSEFSPALLQADFSAPKEEDASVCEIFDSRKGYEKILYLPDVAGGFVADLAIIRALLRQGRQVVLALKDAFYFKSPALWDLTTDPVLQEATEGMFVLDDMAVSKNQLLQYIREHRLVIISDGTSEQMNLCRVSVTFARAWKECDLIIAGGMRNREVFLGTSHEFTRDILCFWRDDDGKFFMRHKAKAASVRKFTETDLNERADGIIEKMRVSREQGSTVMFYSAIIGSIPGQTTTAIRLVTVFVNYLRSKLDNTFIINPAEYFEEGLDGDDLMFMWERVQRSGYLDVWRFQTVEDIEVSFELLHKRLPSSWIGKDATFSTGCTKEMMIAMDEQRKHPELQIIGPAAEKFLRRREYGVGKYSDVKLPTERGVKR